MRGGKDERMCSWCQQRLISHETGRACRLDGRGVTVSRLWVQFLLLSYFGLGEGTCNREQSSMGKVSSEWGDYKRATGTPISPGDRGGGRGKQEAG